MFAAARGIVLSCPRTGRPSPIEVSMAYDVSRFSCVLFLAGACGALVAAVYRRARRARMVSELTEEPCGRIRARLLIHQWLQAIRLLENDPTATDDRIDRWR